jgi:hypothetical protein
MFCWKRAGIVLIFMILDAFSSSIAFVSLVICGIFYGLFGGRHKGYSQGTGLCL